MNKWLINSSTYRFFVLVRVPWKKMHETVGWLYGDSVLKRLINKSAAFLARESNLEKSLFYKLMFRLGSFLRSIAAGLNTFFSNQLNYSFFWKLIKDTDKEFHRDPYVLSGLVFAGFFISYGAAAAIRGNFDTKSIVLLAASFIAAATLIIAKANIKKTVCDSITYRLVFKALKAILQ